MSRADTAGLLRRDQPADRARGVVTHVRAAAAAPGQPHDTGGRVTTPVPPAVGGDDRRRRYLTRLDNADADADDARDVARTLRCQQLPGRAATITAAAIPARD